MLREVPPGIDRQYHLDLEGAEKEKKEAIERAGFLYDVVKDQVKKNQETGEWELRGIPLSNLAKLYEGNDNNEPYNKTIN